MGSQQILLIILGLLVVGVAIAVGIGLFSASSISSNRDDIINDLMNLGQYAYRYKLKPEPMGGGGRSYVGFVIPQVLVENDNASYTTIAIASRSVTLQADSKFGYGSITVVLDSTGMLGGYTYVGEW